MNDLLRFEDLVNNPSTRVPVCLCLDISGSMNRVVGGEVQETGEQIYKDGQTWDIVTGGISAIHELTEGVNAFYQELRSDEVAQYSAEVCIVTFGGVAKLIVDFATIDRQQELPQLIADGDTPMGEAVNLALDCLEERKREYQDNGIDYYQPWLVLMTDGTPVGSSPAELECAIQRTVDMVNSKKLTIFPIGIGPEADMDTLKRFSPKRSPIRLNDMRFKEFFQWLSQSVSRTSMSMPGEKIALDTEGIKGWAEL